MWGQLAAESTVWGFPGGSRFQGLEHRKHKSCAFRGLKIVIGFCATDSVEYTPDPPGGLSGLGAPGSALALALRARHGLRARHA